MPLHCPAEMDLRDRNLFNNTNLQAEGFLCLISADFALQTNMNRVVVIVSDVYVTHTYHRIERVEGSHHINRFLNRNSPPNFFSKNTVGKKSFDKCMVVLLKILFLTSAEDGSALDSKELT